MKHLAFWILLEDRISSETQPVLRAGPEGMIFHALNRAIA